VNKTELVSEVANASGLSQTQAVKAVDATFESISQSLAKGEEVRLVGFGTFKTQDRASSNGRNPRTGEPIKIEAKRLPKFSAGSSLREAVAGNKKQPAKNSSAQKKPAAK
jgi:DNA-binding protein HU-beta